MCEKRTKLENVLCKADVVIDFGNILFAQQRRIVYVLSSYAHNNAKVCI